jgi:hypothetical protein
MEVVLSAGDTLAVTLQDSDGRFEIRFGETAISIWSELPDAQGRDNIIYEEVFVTEGYWDQDFTSEHADICEGIKTTNMLNFFEEEIDIETIKDSKLRYLANALVYIADQIAGHIGLDERQG